MKLKTIFLALLWLTTLAAHAATDGQGKMEAMRGKVPGSYNFWVFTPEEYEAEGRGVPLVIFLHGASLCGNNLEKVRRYGVLHAIQKGKIVRGTQRKSMTCWSGPWHTMPSTPPASMSWA